MGKGIEVWDSLLEKKIYYRMKQFIWNWKTDCCYGRPVPYQDRHYCEFCLRDITVELQFDVTNERDLFTKRYKEEYGKVRVIKVHQKEQNKNKDAYAGGEGSAAVAAWFQTKIPPR